MDEQQDVVRRDGQDDGQVEKRSATELIVGLGGPAIISAGVIGAKLIERLPKKEAQQSQDEKGE